MADSGKANPPLNSSGSPSSARREHYASNKTSGHNRNSVDISKAQRPVSLSDNRPKSMNMSERQRVVTEQDDPLKADVSLAAPKPSKKASLSIKLEDEVRIVKALHDAAKKKTSGRIFSVIVDLSQYPHNLSIGVKDLTDQILCVSLLKRSDDMPGAGEQAGIRLGDVVFGINFMPVRDGSRTLLTQLKAEIETKKSRYVHIQAWRCAQLCSDAVPGYTFPQADELFVRGYDMKKNRVFSVWEMWNFMEILLR
ncbi:hypothetical protein EON64_11400 [archaeon]|nr:MAG: hypothetical protein EON64_11400 [archaeon]